MEKYRLSKKEKYLLKKQKKEKECLHQMRNRKIRKILAISLPAFLVVGGMVFGLLNYSPSENLGTPKIEIVQKEYDAGTISMAQGLARHTFEIKNIGDSDLKIKDIRTSCMCTTARLKIGDEISPEFGMHNNLKFWSQKIEPSETGYLEVAFDPAFHGPQGTGSVVRVIYFSTNDLKNKRIEVKLLADVVE